MLWTEGKKKRGEEGKGSRTEGTSTEERGGEDGTATAREREGRNERGREQRKKGREQRKERKQRGTCGDEREGVDHSLGSLLLPLGSPH